MPLTAMRRDEDSRDTMAVASWNLEAAKGILGPGMGSELRTEMKRGSWRHGSLEVKVEGRAGGEGSG